MKRPTHNKDFEPLPKSFQFEIYHMANEWFFHNQ